MSEMFSKLTLSLANVHALSITALSSITESNVAVNANSIFKLAKVLISLPIASTDRLIPIRTDIGASHLIILGDLVIVVLDVCAMFLNE
jgi:hypothetical protein